jgi:adenine-specific DNA-methyltransferase
MRGYVPTPDDVVDHMVAKLFDGRPPSKSSRVLDPGCGPGAFIAGIVRWCERHRMDLPRITGVESDPGRRSEASRRFASLETVSIEQGDFLAPREAEFDYVIGNPPYVGITRFDEEEKTKFRAEYETARGRFDLYLLFFEQGLRLLRAGGRLVFITPEKFLYVATAAPLRRLLGKLHVRELRLVGEETFPSLVTYPTITTVDKAAPSTTTVVLRDQTTRSIVFPADGSSLLPLFNGANAGEGKGSTLRDVCLRVSCGVATGADEIFVRDTASLSEGLRAFAYPTISGRQLLPGSKGFTSTDSMLVPYDERGRLLPADQLGALGEYLSEQERKKHLLGRTCTERKAWYAFHDSAPLPEILRPKILFKDIGATPEFWLDEGGVILPRHTVYYVVPRDGVDIKDLLDYLRSPSAIEWMRGNCQRAANGFLRLQSAVLKSLPVPDTVVAPPASRLVPKPRSSRKRQEDAQLTLGIGQ